MTRRVRSLTLGGCDRFGAWLDAPIGPAPRELLFSDEFSEELEYSFAIDPEKKFQTSYELGAYLSSVVFAEVTDRVALASKANMWAWLSLAFIDSLLIRSGKKRGLPLAKAHYVDVGPRLAYRLITRTAWSLVNIHAENAKVALGSTRSPWGEMAEQMTASQEIYAHPTFWAAARHLFLDGHGRVRLGATTHRNLQARRDPASQVGLGGVHRLVRTLKQFDRTYNTRVLTAERIVSLLPKEFLRWEQQKNDSQLTR